MKTEQRAIGRISISDTPRPITPNELVHALFGVRTVEELIKDIQVNKDGKYKELFCPDSEESQKNHEESRTNVDHK